MPSIRAMVHRTDPERVVIVPNGSRVTTITIAQARELRDQLDEIIARRVEGATQR